MRRARRVALADDRNGAPVPSAGHPGRRASRLRRPRRIRPDRAIAGGGRDRGPHRLPGSRAGGRLADRVHQAARCPLPPLPAGRGFGGRSGPGREGTWRRPDGSAWIRDRRGGRPRGRSRPSRRLRRPPNAARRQPCAAHAGGRAPESNGRRPAGAEPCPLGPLRHDLHPRGYSRRGPDRVVGPHRVPRGLRTALRGAGIETAPLAG